MTYIVELRPLEEREERGRQLFEKELSVPNIDMNWEMLHVYIYSHIYSEWVDSYLCIPKLLIETTDVDFGGVFIYMQVTGWHCVLTICWPACEKKCQ